MARLGPTWTGSPIGDWSPPVVGLSGVIIISCGGMHVEYLPGEAVLRTFSGSDSTLLPGVSSLHMWADSADFISDFSRVFSISV